MKRKTPPPTLPLTGGGAEQWLTSIATNSICSSPFQGEARWGFFYKAPHQNIASED